MDIVTTFMWRGDVIFVTIDGSFWCVKVDNNGRPEMRKLVNSRIVQEYGEPT